MGSLGFFDPVCCSFLGDDVPTAVFGCRSPWNIVVDILWHSQFITHFPFHFDWQVAACAVSQSLVLVTSAVKRHGGFVGRVMLEVRLESLMGFTFPCIVVLDLSAKKTIVPLVVPVYLRRHLVILKDDLKEYSTLRGFLCLDSF